MVYDFILSIVNIDSSLRDIRTSQNVAVIKSIVTLVN